ncbi:unnamed protein product [Chironomus riparius]|uniref:Uncharacterized protein n=1 Tax=Chironomus riparius TaxID=315576 RepID=A0A9N9S1Q1_9DIPT|nr:unnamed protein product [Chironomus riparius]
MFISSDPHMCMSSMNTLVKANGIHRNDKSAIKKVSKSDNNSYQKRTQTTKATRRRENLKILNTTYHIYGIQNKMKKILFIMSSVEFFINNIKLTYTHMLPYIEQERKVRGKNGLRRKNCVKTRDEK